VKPDDVVGHKTFHDGKGGFRHEPLTRAEADSVMAWVEAAIAERATRYPTAEDAVTAIWGAVQRLKEMGWKDPDYAATDGKTHSVITVGCSAILRAYCSPGAREGERYWWHPAQGDLWPIDPILYFDDEECWPEPRG